MSADPTVYAHLLVLNEALSQLIAGSFAGHKAEAEETMKAFAQRMQKTQLDSKNEMNDPQWKIDLADNVEIATRQFCDRVLRKVPQ